MTINKLRSLFKSTDGNGELVGILVAVFAAVTFGLVVMTTLGGKADQGAGQVGDKIMSQLK